MSIDNGCYAYKSCINCEFTDCLVNKQKAEIERLKRKISVKENYIEKLESEIDDLNYELKQAIKDTAQEILQYVGNLCDDYDERFKLKDYQWHRNLCKQYGVEVEK